MNNWVKLCGFQKNIACTLTSQLKVISQNIDISIYSWTKTKVASVRNQLLHTHNHLEAQGHKVEREWSLYCFHFLTTLNWWKAPPIYRRGDPCIQCELVDFFFNKLRWLLLQQALLTSSTSFVDFFFNKLHLIGHHQSLFCSYTIA